MSTPQLRPYQAEIIAEFERRVAAGQRRLIIVMPTGSGKTVVAAEIARKVAAEKQRALFLAHRREIISQTSQKLFDVELDHGIIQAGFPDRLAEPVQVASIQTLHSRAIRGSRITLPQAHLVIIDECHHATAETYRKIIAAYPDAILVGLTATPCRGDGRGLGGIFDALIECPQVQELVDSELPRGHAGVRANDSRSRRRPRASRRLRRIAACRAHGPPEARGRHCRALAPAS